MINLLSDVMPIFALPLFALCAVTPVVIIALIVFFAVKKKKGRKDGFDKVLDTPDYVRNKSKTSKEESVDESTSVSTDKTVVNVESPKDD